MPHVTTADKTNLFYKDWGSGRPIVLIHGWPLNADMWEYQSVFLASHGFRVIAYDRRGFGRSSQPWSGYDYDTLAGDLKCLLDTLDLQDATLVGFSMGGGEVARYLGRHGGARVAKAVFLASVTPYLQKDASNEDGVEPAIFETIREGLKQDRPGFLNVFGKAFYGAGMLNFGVSSGILEWTLMMAMQASPRATLECVTAFAATDFRADLAEIRGPSLVIHGGGDNTVPAAKSGQRAAKMIAGAEYLEYAGAPHGLFYTERDRLNQDLLRFCQAGVG